MNFNLIKFNYLSDLLVYLKLGRDEIKNKNIINILDWNRTKVLILCRIGTLDRNVWLSGQNIQSII